jgi:DNA polymerase-3 subunit delta'
MTLEPAAMNVAAADAMPWLQLSQARLRAAAAAGRLPHSLLVLCPAGLGAELLAEWTGAFALCEADGERPCGACVSCRLLQAGSHPDLHVVKLEEDAQQIKVDQVRELIDALTTKSYRGGYKVGVIAGAETLNSNGANAFLKTLEEPTQNTLLILTAKPTHRLPATIASRCLRLAVRPPSTEQAVAWLHEHAPACADWRPALRLAGGAPLLARELQAQGLVKIDQEMHGTMQQLAEDALDLSLVAESWLKSNAVLRVTWLENWITARIRTSLAGACSGQNVEPVRLPAALLKAKIRHLYELLDAARQFKRLTSTGMNQQLALEALLIGGRSALAK